MGIFRYSLASLLIFLFIFPSMLKVFSLQVTSWDVLLQTYLPMPSCPTLPPDVLVLTTVVQMYIFCTFPCGIKYFYLKWFYTFKTQLCLSVCVNLHHPDKFHIQFFMTNVYADKATVFSTKCAVKYSYLLRPCWYHL